MPESAPEGENTSAPETERPGTPDAISGLIIMGTGIAVVVGMAANHPIGTLAHMRLGFFPVAVASLMAVLGLAIALPGLRRRAPLPRPSWSVGIATITGLVLFGLSIQTLGLVPAIFLIVFAATMPDRNYTFVTRVGVAVVTSLISWSVFGFALGLEVTMFRLPW